MNFKGILSLISSRKSWITIVGTLVAWLISQDEKVSAIAAAFLAGVQSYGISIEDAGNGKKRKKK